MTFDVFIMPASNQILTNFIVAVNEHCIVGLYDYELMSKNTPCFIRYDNSKKRH